MSKSPSLISGKSQPIQKIQIGGDVFDGACCTCFKVFFENKRDDPIEISFSFPLPLGVAATHFDIEYADKKVTSKISNSDDAKLEYDDAIASSEFAAIVVMTASHELRIDLGPLAPKEKCVLSLYYDIGLTALPDGFLLILPTTIADSKNILCLGLNPPPIELNLHIKDTQKIKAITTPFTETNIDLQNGIVSSSDLKLYHPVHIVVKYEEPFTARCVVHKDKNYSYLRLSASAPRADRLHPSSFTFLLEHSTTVTSSEFSIMLRALEFFMISLPTDCKVNIQNYGLYDNSLFDGPSLISDNEIRTKALNFCRNPIPNEKKELNLKDALAKSLKSVDISKEESILVLIGAPYPENLSIPEGHIVIMLDPFSQGNMEECSTRNGALYIPVPDEQSLIGALLSIIKMTGAGRIQGCYMLVNEIKVPVLPVIPSVTFSMSYRIEGDVKSVKFFYGDDLFVNAKISHTDLRAVKTIWALQEFLNNSTDPDVINAILTPDKPAIAVIEREDEIEGDITLVETKMSAVGLQWEERSIKRDESPQPIPNPIPQPIPYPRPIPHPIPRPGPFPPHPMPVPLPYPMPIIQPYPLPIRQPRGEIPEHAELHSATAENSRMTGGGVVANDNENISNRRACIRPFHPIRVLPPPEKPKKDKIKVDDAKMLQIDYQTILDEANKRSKEEAQKVIASKKPFFLLKLLQLQNADGSWSDDAKLKICCGYEVPQNDTGLEKSVFLTLFVIACLRNKGINDRHLWELAAEKAFSFLAKVDAEKDWEEEIAKIVSKLK